MNFKVITHWFAVAIAAVAAFALTSAGQALIAQYPKLSVAFGVIGAIAALYHNPKTATAVLIFALLLLGSPAMAQTVVSQPWSATTSVLSLPGNHQTIAASDSGLAFTPTPNLDIFDRNLIASDSTMKYFAGGANYRIAWLNKKLDSISPNVNFLRVQTFVTASAGIEQVSLAGVTKNHYGFTAGGGANYMLNQSGSWTLGGSVEWAKFPGYQNNGLIVKFGPTFHF